VTQVNQIGETKQGAVTGELERGGQSVQGHSVHRGGRAAGRVLPGGVSSLDQPQLNFALSKPLGAVHNPARVASTVSKQRRDQPRAGRRLAPPPNRGQAAPTPPSTDSSRPGAGWRRPGRRSAGSAFRHRRSQLPSPVVAAPTETVEHPRRRLGEGHPQQVCGPCWAARRRTPAPRVIRQGEQKGWSSGRGHARLEITPSWPDGSGWGEAGQRCGRWTRRLRVRIAPMASPLPIRHVPASGSSQALPFFDGRS